jgi:hypothetical protein
MGALPVASTLENTSFNKSAASHLHSSTNHTIAFHDSHFYLRAGCMPSFLKPFPRSSTTECLCELRAIACHYPHMRARSENLRVLIFSALLANNYPFQSIQHQCFRSFIFLFSVSHQQNLHNGVHGGWKDEKCVGARSESAVCLHTGVSLHPNVLLFSVADLTHTSQPVGRGAKELQCRQGPQARR